MNRRLCVAADVRSYGRANTQVQLSYQRDLLAVLERSAQAAGLERTTWWRAGSGDSDFAVLPDSEPEATVVDRFVREFDAELSRHNAQRVEDAKMRVRVAIHFGPTVLADNGYAGPAPVEVHRLLDSAPLKAALAENPAADLALLLSDVVYRDTVEQGHTTLRAAEFERVTVAQKEFSGTAWLWLPAAVRRGGGDTAARTSGARSEAPREREAAQHVETTVNGPVSGESLFFGIRNG